MQIVIAGGGFVGQETWRLFPNALIYDPIKTVRDYVNTPKMQQHYCHKPPNDLVDYCFICVPTPMLDNGQCDVTAVEDVFDKVQACVYIIKSTVYPGYTQRRKCAVFCPEYVASSSPYPAPLGDVTKRGFVILGGEKKHVKKVRELYESVYPPTVDILEVSALEAELIKLLENTAIAAKVTLAQEFYEICKAYKVDYSVIQQGVFGLDPRFNKWFTNVYPYKRGFTNSHCLSKDISNLVLSCQLEKGYDPKFIRAIIENNKRWINGCT
jgi:UDPglucose 6-dehydrogenase